MRSTSGCPCIRRIERGANEGLQDVIILRGAARQERGHYRARAGFDGEADRKARIDVVGRRLLVFYGRGEIFLAAERGDFKPLSVHADFELLAIFDSADDVGSGPPQANSNFILAIEWEVMDDLDSAVRPQRQPFEMVVL